MTESTTADDYLALFRHLPGSFLLLRPDAEFTVVDHTEQHAAVSMKSRAEVVGRPIFEAYPAADQNQADVLRASLEHVRRHREAHTMPVIRYDLERPAALGGGLEERYWQATHFPVPGPDGQLRYILQQTQDVTASHLAEQQAQQAQRRLAATEERNRLLLESLPLMIWTTRPDGGADYQNPWWLRFTGRTLAQAQGWGWLEDIHPDDRAGVNEAWHRALRTGDYYQVEYRLRRHDGEYRWLLVQAVAERDEAGAITAWVGTGTEIHDQKITQQQLAAKDQELQQILSQLPAAVATVQGPDFRYAFFTPSYQELMGGRIRLGERAADLLPEVAAQGHIALLEEVYGTQQSYVGLEVPVQLWDATTGGQREYFMNLVYQPLLDGHGATQGILAFGIDVTEQVLARRRNEELQAEVHRQDSRLRRLTEALPAVSFILDHSLRLEYVSPQWHAITGYPIGTDIDAVWPTLVHPDDHATAYDAYTRAVAAHETLAFEYRLRHADGQYRWQVCRVVPELNAAGLPLRWYGTLVDNHTQRELQNELLRSEAQYRFMAESIPQLVWTARPDGQIDYMNQRWEELTNLPIQQALGLSWAKLVPPADAEEVLAKFMRDIRLGHPHEQESKIYSAREGQYRWFLHRATPMRNTEGQVVRWFGTSTDIHDSKQSQQQLQAQNEQLRHINEDLDNFVYTASHDLKQPVTNMSGIFQELMRSATFADPAASTLAQMFERALHQMHDTVQDLSAVVQVQRQHEQLQAEAIELEPFVRDVVRAVQDQLPRPGASFTLDFAAVPVLLFVRPNLQSVLYNLLSNALKYASPDRAPHVHVSTLLDNGTPVLRIQDNGLGIDLVRHGQHLFKMFRRFHDHVQGSGMGLYLVNRIVQQLQGHLRVESTVGEGTTFSLHLPGTLAPSAAPALPLSATH